MANNCDDVFQQIQALQQQRQALIESQNVLQSTDPPEGGDGPPQGPKEMDPARRWLISDRQTGQTYEANMAELDNIRRSLNDGDFTDLVAGRIDAREKPLGREGQFTNFAQLVDRMGVDNAQQAGELIQAVTGRWEDQVPADYQRAIQINDKGTLLQRVANSYAEAGIRVELDTLSQGIAKDAAPFMSILDKQANLQVFNVVARDNLLKAMDALQEEIKATGLPPTPDAKQAFMDAAAKAVFAERSAAISRRVSGQLLQQLKGDFSQAPGLVGKAFREQLQAEAEKLFNGEGTLITEGTLAAQVVQAADLGQDGLKDLKDLVDTVRAEGIDPSNTLDQDWSNNWRRQARAFYKDSMLFNLNTQFVSNYLSNKAVYWMEGYRAGWNNTFSLPNTGTPDLMGMLKKPLQGHRIAFTAKLLTDDVVRQAVKDALGDAMPEGFLAGARGSWQQVIQKGVMEGRNPFADVKSGVEVDASSGSAMTIEDQFRMANKVLFGEQGVPQYGTSGTGPIRSFGENIVNEVKINPAELPFILRDRIHLGTKIIANHFIEKAIKTTTGKEVRLPITGALQTLAAVDSRTGLRVYTAVRANDLLMQTFKDQPDIKKMSWEERTALVKEQLGQELYKATPDKAQIDAYREQFGMPDEVSDDEISAKIAAKHVGAPVLDTPERLEAFEFSRYARMQTPPKIQLLKDFDDWVQKARENSYVDAVLPFWRSGASGMAYVAENMTPPIVDTARLVFGKVDEETKAKTMASWMVFTTWAGMFLGLREGLHAITSSAPGKDKNEREQWKRRYDPNTFFGVSGLGQLPIISVFQTMNDVAEAVEQGVISRYDQKGIFYGLWQVFSGQLYRTAGFGQFRTMNDALMSQNPKQFWRAVGFIANGQLNPGSGVFRQIERLGGLGSDARYEPRYENPSDLMLRDRAEDLPTASILDRIREKLYYVQPLFSNQPLKEKDYLGRDLRTPEGWFQREWPTGWPGVYDAAVHNQLLEIGMLQPPRPLMDGRLDGVPMGSDLEKEFNGHVGSVVGGSIARDPRFAGRLTWQGSTVVMMPNGRERTQNTKVSMARFMAGLTDGATLHESLNRLFTSSTWEAWQGDASTTLSPRKAGGGDAPKSELLKRPGAKVVRLLHEYYGALASDQIEVSESDAAATWRELRMERLSQMGTPEDVRATGDFVRQSLQ